ncbi:MAG TPA: hypothetical protein VG406_05520 [Isosphaeraceae bacterium]|jgi:hypothetical protein|nr:hypothetical protein [Isosphaeraceae bacterium]
MRSSRVDALARLAVLFGVTLAGLGFYDISRAGPGQNSCVYQTTCNTASNLPPGYTCVNATPPNPMTTATNTGSSQIYYGNGLCGNEQYQGQDTGFGCGGAYAQIDPNC